MAYTCARLDGRVLGLPEEGGELEGAGHAGEAGDVSGNGDLRF